MTDNQLSGKEGGGQQNIQAKGEHKKVDRSQERVHVPFSSPLDPCPPLPFKRYVVPPNQYITFQPPNWPQFSPQEALRVGTLWPALYSPYRPNRGGGEEANE